MVDINSYTINQILQDIASLRESVVHMQQLANFNTLNVTTLAVSGSSALGGETSFTPQPSGFTGSQVCVQVSAGTHTVTQNVATTLTAAYTIPANDAQVGTIYKILAAGSGTQGSTQQILTFWATGFGNNSGAAGYTATDIAASQGFVWWAETWIQIASLGVSGTANYSMRSGIRQSGAGAGFTLNGYNAAVGIDTTSATTTSLSASWGATTGAPTLTANGSVCERMGP